MTWAIDTMTGAERMLVDSRKLGGRAISEEEKMRRERLRIVGSRGIVDYDWAPMDVRSWYRSTETCGSRRSTASPGALPTPPRSSSTRGSP